MRVLLSDYMMKIHLLGPAYAINQSYKQALGIIVAILSFGKTCLKKRNQQKEGLELEDNMERYSLK